MDLISEIVKRAKANKQRIVLPEGTEERTLKAANQILTDGVADLILLGNPDEIMNLAKEWGLGNIHKATIIDPENNPKQEEYAQLLCELRKKKGMTIEEARKLVLNPLYLGCLIIKAGDADGQLAGARNTTGDVLRPALQIIKTAPGITCVSGAMLMLTHAPECGDNGVLVMGDVAVTPVPDANQLAQIAICTAQTAKAVAGIDPRVAMLSFSTKGSAKHEVVDKVVEALKIAKELPIAGQMGMETASFSLSAIMVGWLGSTALASYQIMIAVSQVCFMMYYGMGSAVSVRISYFFGQKDLEHVRHTARSGFHIILAMIVLTGIPIFLLRHYIGGWFTNDEAVSLMVAQLIIPFLLYQFGDGLQINFANALRGIADVRPMMLFSFIAYFLISLPAGYLFGFVCGWGAIGIWAAFPFGLTSAGIMYYLRFRYKTKSIR